jgi:integrase
MPRLVGERLPKYGRHKASGQAIVKLCGRDVYLGPYGTKASRVEYDRVVSEWLSNGRSLRGSAVADLTVNELAARYLRFAKGYYRKNGEVTDTLAGIKAALRYLCRQYGRSLARDFGPLSLEAIRNKMIAANLSRSYINALVDMIRRAFRWSVSQELIPVEVHQALCTLVGLRRGRSLARESQPVLPISESLVASTLSFLRPTVADMLRVQLLCGCRPEEICMLRPCDVDTSDDVWRYRPASHKTEHHGREKVIFFGPKAQRILAAYFKRDAKAYCFCPAETRAAHNIERSQNRKSPMTPSQASRKPKRRPKRKPRDHYTTDTYRRAIHRACDLSDKAAHLESPDIPAETRIVERWAPNRLRHSAGTEIRRRFGLEAAQVALGSED